MLFLEWYKQIQWSGWIHEAKQKDLIFLLNKSTNFNCAPK